MSTTPRAAVASPHHLATAVGADVLRDGGNALDACVAMSAMLAVVYPHMAGLGGDAFMLHFEASRGAVACLNGSGGAPALATAAAYRTRGLDAPPARGPLSVTVPGAVGAWAAALARFGSRPLAELLAPATQAAADGVELGTRLSARIAEHRAELAADPALSELFLDGDGEALPAHARVRQPHLAAALRRLAEAGAHDLYHGELAREVARACEADGGLLRAADLAGYVPTWVRPISVRHRGLDVVTSPPNSQGIAALMMLNNFAAAGAETLAPGSAEYVEAFVRAKRPAFADRDRHVTDPCFHDVPVERLLSPAHARTAVTAWAGAGAPAAGPVGGDTVYLCAVDARGNACSFIQSVYYAFGSGYVAGRSGILLQNRGHYFSLEESHPNRLAPGKRTLHTLMPCLALADGRPRYVFGTMGGDGQPQTSVQVLHRLLAGEAPQAAVSAPRVQHGRANLEDDPDLLTVEADLGDEVVEALAAGGHLLSVLPPHDERLGHAQAISVEADGRVQAGADPRSDGSAAEL